MTNSNQNKGDKSKRQRNILIAAAIVALVIIVALISIIVILLMPDDPPEPELIHGPQIGGYERNLGGRGFVVTEYNVEEMRAEIEAARVDPADMRFEFSKTADWIFPAALEPSTTAMVRNVERNSRTVFFDVYVEGFGVVYASPYMPLGSTHRNFALSVELPAGEYSAMVTYFLVDDDFEIITNVSTGVTITIQN